MAAKKYYLTTPIYYVNARPHIGHAYSTIVADVLARRHRLLGDDTYFLTGTDEHGQKIERAAAAAGIPPQQYADQVSKTFSDLWHRMGITNDQFIRTTGDGHKQGVQKLFADLYAKGQIYLSTYTGQYSVGEEMFVEGPPGTIGPDGRPTETVTEENFFFSLSRFQPLLIDLIESGDMAITPESSKNEVMSFLRGNIDRRYNQDFISVFSDTDSAIFAKQDETSPYTKIEYTDLGHAFLPGALKDLSISRSSFTWGIPVPEDIQINAGAKEKHVIYVWLDALANYMTALGYGSTDDTLWQKFWPAELHLVGKEITRFHCVYWPAFLLAAGLPVPKQVTANGWLLFDNSKMSKSKGNVVRTETILEGFGEHVYAKQFPESTKPERDLFASDVLRYYLLREIPFGQDGSFSFDTLITRYNAELANGYGNLVSRTLSMMWQYRDGVITPKTEIDGLSALIQNLAALQTKFGVEIDRYSFSSALDLIREVIFTVDFYVSAQSPWRLAKSNEGRDAIVVSEVLYIATETIRIVTAYLHPFLPYATAKVWHQLGLGDIEAAARNGDLKNLEWGGLKPGTKLGPLSPIFPRADKGLSALMTNLEELASGNSNLATESTNPPSLAAPSSQPEADKHNPPSFDPAAGPRTASLPDPTGTLSVGGSYATTTRTGPTPSHTEAQASGIFAPSPIPSEITIDDFTKIELRVAQITLAERIPKADKLLRLEVDLGPLGTRQILSGIAEHYTPDDLTGRKIVVITNLAPRKMRGLESHGMLLAASDGEGGKPILATFAEDIPNGTRLK
jgi:methionyl-tRNA synthetase